MQYKIEGRLIKKFDVKEVGVKKFRVREFVIETKGQYPQKVSLQLVKDNVLKIDNYNLGDDIEVKFNINGREWSKDGQTRYFNTLQAWDIAYIAAAFDKMQQVGEVDDIPW